MVGERKNKNIRINRILDFEIYSNGVQIEKDAGASPFLQFCHSAPTQLPYVGEELQRHRDLYGKGDGR